MRTRGLKAFANNLIWSVGPVRPVPSPGPFFNSLPARKDLLFADRLLHRVGVIYRMNKLLDCIGVTRKDLLAVGGEHDQVRNRAAAGFQKFV